MRIDSIIKKINNFNRTHKSLVKLRDHEHLVTFGIRGDRGIERRIEFHLSEGHPYDLTYTNTMAKQSNYKADHIEDFNIRDMDELWNLCNAVCSDAENIRRD